jgi:hypothetical protein
MSSDRSQTKAEPPISALRDVRSRKQGAPFLRIVVSLGAAFVVAIPVGCQTRPPLANAVAEEIVCRQILISYMGGRPDTSLYFREPALPLDLLLALHTYLPSGRVDDRAIKSALTSLEFTRLRLQATLELGYEQEVRLTSAETASETSSGLTAAVAGSELRRNRAVTDAQAGDLTILASKLRSSEHLQSLMELKSKAKGEILRILNSQPSLLKPFADREPLSQELLDSRKKLRLVLQGADKQK